LESSLQEPAGFPNGFLGHETVLEHTSLFQVFRELCRVVLLGLALFLELQATRHESAKDSAVEWLEEKVKRAFFEGPIEFFIGLGDRAGHEDDVGFRTICEDLLAQRIPIPIKKLNVDDSDPEVSLLQALQRSGDTFSGLDVIESGEDPFRHATHAGVIIYH
jgi:hypothetical protein